MSTNSIDDGGPAFPVVEANGVNNGMFGITVRDYFAAKAMQGLIAQSLGCAYSTNASISEEAARLASAYTYQMADAMLKARGV